MTADPAPPRAPWQVVAHRGTAEALHGLEMPTRVVRAVWEMTLTHDALVLGSTQSSSVVDPAVLDGGRVAVVTRRSGGGAVLLRAADSFWLDVLVPADDPLWVDDVGRSFDWLGAVWIRALRSLDLAGADDLAAFAGPLRRSAASDLVCFAGLGPGEVTSAGRKVIGLSQRRTRAGARFQCLAYLGAATAAEAIVALLAEPHDPDERAALQALLETRVAALPVSAAALTAAFVRALPH